MNNSNQSLELVVGVNIVLAILALVTAIAALLRTL